MRHPHSASANDQCADAIGILGKCSFIHRSLISHMYLVIFHQPDSCNIAGKNRPAGDQPTEHAGDPWAAHGGTRAALPAYVAGLDHLLAGLDLGSAAGRAPSLALRSTTNSSFFGSDEYIACCFSLCGHPACTNGITCPLCRHSQQVRTRLEVPALHWALLHCTGAWLTPPTRHSRTPGRRRHTSCNQGTCAHLRVLVSASTAAAGALRACKCLSNELLAGRLVSVGGGGSRAPKDDRST